MINKNKTHKKSLKNKNSIILDNNIIPIKYDITIKPDFESFNFWGKEIIDIDIKKNTKKIVIHAKDLDIETAHINEEFAHKISYDTDAETATFEFKKNIKGKTKMTLVFTGIISDTLRGFYKSQYEINGEKKYIATTQFEATDARRAFPCFDEPAKKAIFDVHFIIPSDKNAISNTLPKSIKEHEEGYKIVSFESTPKMSTYLLAFIIGDFEYIEGFTKEKGKTKKVQVRVYTTPGKKNQAKFALDTAIKTLEFYNDYFDIPYPLPTLDMIAIPDFESGAMENWGAITYRETALLVDEDHTSLSNKEWVALVIAHEIAHQWFGNLVTMHWWTDLWLNEGFASYIEYLAVDHIFPEWRIWDEFLTNDMAIALRLDSLKNSHPIEVEVHHPNEISEIFDAVSYSKGATVIKMLAEYLGYKNFRNGLRYYLKKHSYQNTKTTDLWESLSLISKKDISSLMKNWTGKTGYPVLDIKKEKDLYIINQERFFSSRISKKENKEKTLWKIPLKYREDKKINEILIENKNTKIKGKNITKFNLGENTLVRVKYDSQILEKIKEDILNQKLSSHDHLGIIRDLFALAESGHINTVEALSFVSVFKDEEDYMIWSEISNGLNRIYNLIYDFDFKEQYKAYALSVFKNITQKMGFEEKKNEKHSDVFLRNLVLSNSAMYGDEKIIKEAKKIFNQRKNKTINPNIRSVIYSIVASNGGKKEWNLFEKLYRNEKMHEEKNRYGGALASFKDKKLLEKTLLFSISDHVRDQDKPSIISSVWSNKSGRDLTFKFVMKNWNLFLKKYGDGGHFLGRLISPLGSHTKKEDAKIAKQFFKKHILPGAERTLEQALERIYSNDAWIKADKIKIKNGLKNNFK